MTMKLVFMGTPAFAVPVLTALHQVGHRIAAVYTQPPRPAGRRGLAVTKSPVHECAEALRLKVNTPVSLKDEGEQSALREIGADAAVVVAYGLLLPQAVLDAPRLGCYNAHASLLPRWRGAAPIQRAIMAGDAETGVSIMKMDAGLDTGPVAMEQKVPIAPDMTAGELHDALMGVAATLMVRAMGALKHEKLVLTPQPEAGAVYARKIDKAETRIGWARPAAEVHNHVRGLAPAPGAWCEVTVNGRAERLKVLRSAMAEGSGAPGAVLSRDLAVACGDGAVRLLQVQRAGGNPVSGADFLRGVPVRQLN